MRKTGVLSILCPGVSRVAVLSNPTTAAVPPQMRETEVAARALGVQPQPLEMRGPEDFDRVFQAATKERAGALITLDDAFVFIQRTRIVKLAAKSAGDLRIQGVCGRRLMSYAANLSYMYSHAATYVDKILKGAKPADLPVEQPTKFELVINLKAAKQIGLTIPPNVLVRAGEAGLN